jgi:hypothetical protein
VRLASWRTSRVFWRVDRLDARSIPEVVVFSAAKRIIALHVLREAAAAVADAREEERRADAPVGPDRPAHVSTSAPTSQTLATSFMNEMRVASMALAAYFVSSALAQSITMIGAPVRVNGA